MCRGFRLLTVPGGRSLDVVDDMHALGVQVTPVPLDQVATRDRSPTGVLEQHLDGGHRPLPGRSRS